MSANVIQLRPKASQELEGDAFCLQCRHEWVAVAPSGVVWLRCPECLTEKGLFRYKCAPPDTTPTWVCDCGNELFYLTPVGHLCANCGSYNSYD